MITDNGKLKCDWCGQFICIDPNKPPFIKYTPDSEFTRESVEQICYKCEHKDKGHHENKND